MGGIGDLLKGMGGMGGMGGGMPGGMPGGMGEMGGGGGGGGMKEMLGKMMSNPKAMAAMQQAQNNPKLMKIMQEVHPFDEIVLNLFLVGGWVVG
jgi:hypothetical protein